MDSSCPIMASKIYSEKKSKAKRCDSVSNTNIIPKINTIRFTTIIIKCLCCIRLLKVVSFEKMAKGII